MPTPETDPDRIKNLVEKLPEVYQPIYGHPEFTQRASRACDDRLAAIVRCYDSLAALLGRPLKVLDLGCAQGYFGFGLAARGAQVHGVDQLEANVELCRKLAAENPKLQATFEVGSAEEAIADLEPEAYDLILGLSVLHHVIHAKGQAEVGALIERASFCVGALILELALREEPLYWAPAQPADPRDLLAKIGFVREIARFSTHLSEIPRPLYVASRRYWVFDDQAGQFESWSDEPHALGNGTHCGSRRYFFGADTIVKQYRFDQTRGEFNLAEFGREKWFAEHAPRGFSLPEPIAFLDGRSEAWVRMRRWRGRLLLDYLREEAPLDRKAIVLAVLEQLAILEGEGLYHSDLRTWNVLIGDGQEVYVLDFGSISQEREDCVWPGSPFLSFLIFVREVATGVVDDPRLMRTVSISPFGLPQPFRSWAEDLWQKPLNEWTFGGMRALLLQTKDTPHATSRLLPGDAWMRAVEEALQIEKVQATHQEKHAIYLEKKIAAIEAGVKWNSNRALRAVEAVDARMRALESENATTLRVFEQEAKLEIAAGKVREQEQLRKIAVLEVQAEAKLEIAAGKVREQEQLRKIAVLELQAQYLEERIGAQRREAELRRDLGAAKARAVLLEVSESEARRGESAALALRAESDLAGSRASALAAQFEKQTQALVAKLDQTTTLANTQREEIELLREKMDALSCSAEEQRWRAESLRFQVESMLASKSWRATAPLRWWGASCRDLKASIVEAAKKTLYGFLGRAPRMTSAAVRFVMRRPLLRARIDRFVMRHPHLRDRLKSIAFSRDIHTLEPVHREYPGPVHVDTAITWRCEPAVGQGGTRSFGVGVSPRMRRFLRELEASAQNLDKGRH